MNSFLAIDQGTTSSRAIVFNSDLEVIVESQKEYELTHPSNGWVEADPNLILDTVQETITNVLNNYDGVISSCGLTNQRETTIVWSKQTGKAIYPAIIWQDRRTNKLCEELKNLNHEEMIKEKTGLVLSLIHI